MSNRPVATPGLLLEAWCWEIVRRLPKEAYGCLAMHVVAMPVEEFLELTWWEGDDLLLGDPPLDPDLMPDWPELPCLHVYEDGEVSGHEGRQRVAAAQASGLAWVPIVVWLICRAAVEAGDLDALREWTSHQQPLPERPWRSRNLSPFQPSMGVGHRAEGERYPKQLLATTGL